MSPVILTRSPSTPNGTFGVLSYQQIPLCVTVERPWANNQHGISCVPLGCYPCKPFNSPKNGQVWLLENVTGRDMIEIHAANLATQLEGCIAPGEKFSMFGEVPGVSYSKDTLRYLQGVLPAEFDLIIVQPT